MPTFDSGTFVAGVRTLPYLVMPRATPIRQALRESSFREIVEAIRELSHTLAVVHENLVEHRDIKPGNLFKLDEKWVFGDWGLVRFPEKDAITDHGKRLGPLYYIADEMLQPGEVLDSRPADVYSLGKTLYALAAHADFPPQGQLRYDSRRDSLTQWTDDPRAQNA